jgi:hypothetical protein
MTKAMTHPAAILIKPASSEPVKRTGNIARFIEPVQCDGHSETMSIGAVPDAFSTRAVGREDLDNVIEANVDGCAGQAIEVSLRTDEVERAVDVCVLLRGRQAESWR